MNKLFTKEDPLHLHKICGFASIINYGIQFYKYFFHNTVNLNIYTLSPHIFLHISSFIFTVLQYRPTESIRSMFIWNELRIHAMLFALRACFAILFLEYSKTINKHIIIFIISLLTMIGADITTYYYGTEGISTVRGQQSKVGYRSIYKELSGAFFSISQFGATVITMGLFQHSPSQILIFSTLPPIQTSAFGMTLIRKNIINKNAWGVVYTLELLMTYFIWYKEYKNINIFFISLIMYLFRRYGASKYIIWIFSYLFSEIYKNYF